jgi:hypothetical protein
MASFPRFLFFSMGADTKKQKKVPFCSVSVLVTNMKINIVSEKIAIKDGCR